MRVVDAGRRAAYSPPYRTFPMVSEVDMKHEPDYGWNAVVTSAQALMVTAVAGGIAILAAVVLGLV